jgi:hypothetical protein
MKKNAEEAIKQRQSRETSNIGYIRRRHTSRYYHDFERLLTKQDLSLPITKY